MELAGQGITVTAIAPGYVNVKPGKPAPERSAFREAMPAKIPMGRRGSPVDVADDFLLSGSISGRTPTLNPRGMMSKSITSGREVTQPLLDQLSR